MTRKHHPIFRIVTIGLSFVYLANYSVASAAPPNSLSTGNDLLAMCEDNESALSFGLCNGFISGVLSRDRLAGIISPGGQIVCIPNGVNNGQIRDVVLKFLRANPQKRHYDAGQLVLQALDEAFGYNRFACVQSPKPK